MNSICRYKWFVVLAGQHRHSLPFVVFRRFLHLCSLYILCCLPQTRPPHNPGIAYFCPQELFFAAVVLQCETIPWFHIFGSEVGTWQGWVNKGIWFGEWARIASLGRLVVEVCSSTELGGAEETGLQTEKKGTDAQRGAEMWTEVVQGSIPSSILFPKPTTPVPSDSASYSSIPITKFFGLCWLRKGSAICDQRSPNPCNLQPVVAFSSQSTCVWCSLCKR